MKRSTIKLGTRGSPLALAQTQLVIDRLREHHPDLRLIPVVIKTSGDRIKTAAELRRAGKGLFVKEIERALLTRKIDCAVHSLKDMPSDLPDGLAFGAIPARDEAADAYIGRADTPIDKLPPKSVIGTASLRRQALMRAVYPTLEFEELRGNLDTRLAKLRSPRSRLAGIVVAAAGLTRLYPTDTPAHQLLAKDVLVPAAGQGALAIEIRARDEDLRELLAPLHHELTAGAVTVERAVLRRLEGGCQLPLGVYAEASDDGLVRVRAALAAPDGSNLMSAEATGTVEDPESVAEALETMLRNRGAAAILEAIRPGRPRLAAAARPRSNGHRRRASSRRRAKSRR